MRGPEKLRKLGGKVAVGVLGEFGQDFLVEPHVHFGRAFGVDVGLAVAKVERHFFSLREAAVHVDEFHEIDDGGAPREIFGMFFFQLVELGREFCGAETLFRFQAFFGN